MIVRRALLVLLLVSSSALAAEPIQLRAGRLAMVFEPDHAFLRYIRVGEHQILQGISAPVRDQFWGTVPPEVKNLGLTQTKDAFDLTFEVSCRQGEIDFRWQGRIRGSADGRLTFTFDGEAGSDFLRNRIGFCVLHGPEVAGKKCRVQTVKGETIEGQFPLFISPHQPFKSIHAITHEVAPGVSATVRMEGETFEMEDQRNWTDASYKTYCTPLEIPYPVAVTKGAKVRQKIEITVEGIATLPQPETGVERRLLLQVAEDGDTRPLPGIGLRVSSQTADLTESEVARLRALRLDHLRVDLNPADGEASADLRRAAQQAQQVGAKLHVALHLGEQGEQALENLAGVLKDIQPPHTWLAITATDAQVAAVRAFLAHTGQQGRLGRGEDTNFTELNRNRPDPHGIAAVSYGINPQIHAFDNTSIVETLAIQADTVQSARQFSGELPLLISPITLKKQAIDQAAPAGELPPNVDPRQTSAFAAGWTLGSIKYLSEAGADGLTYYETVGWLGVMESAAGSPLPDRFPSEPGQLFPIYHVLRELAEFDGGVVRPVTSTDPMSVVGMAVVKGEQRRVIVANLGSTVQTANLRGFGRLDGVREVGTANAPKPKGQELAVTASDGTLVLTLQPYAIVAVDGR